MSVNLISIILVFVTALSPNFVRCNIIRGGELESNTTFSNSFGDFITNSGKLFQNTFGVLQNRTAGALRDIKEILDFGQYERPNGLNPFNEMENDVEKSYENKKGVLGKKTADVFNTFTDKLDLWGSEIRNTAENLEENPAIKGTQEAVLTFMESAQTFGLQAPHGVMNLFENGFKEMNLFAKKFGDFAKEKLSIE